MQQPNTFTFDDEIQSDILRLMASEPLFSEASTHWIKPDYFQKPSQQWFAKAQIDFFEQYLVPPTAGEISEILKSQERKDEVRPDTAVATRKLINTVYDGHLAGTKEFTVDLVKDFARQRAWQKAILEAYPLVQSGNYADVATMMDEASNAVYDLDAGGYWFFEAAEQRIQRRASDELDTDIIPLGIMELDLALRRGGVGPGEIVLWTARNGGGKCVSGDTLVLTPDHGLVRIKEIVGTDREGWHKLASSTRVIDQDGQPAIVSDVYCNGMSKTIKIKLRNGVRVEGTNEHPLLVTSDDGWRWKRMGEIEKGDFVAQFRPSEQMQRPVMVKAIPELDQSALYQTARPLTKFPREMTPELSEWTGWLLAEGYIGSPPSSPTLMTFTNKDATVLDLFRVRSRDLFGMTWRETNRKGSTSFSINSRAMYMFLEQCLGVFPGLSKDKHVPDVIMQSPAHVQSSFLRAYFEAEGHVQKRTRIELSSASEQMMRSIQVLLHSFGISSSLRSKMGKATNGLSIEREYWRINVSGVTNLILFQSEIGFYPGSKKDRALDAALIAASNVWKSDIVPGASFWLKAIKKERQILDRRLAVGCAMPKGSGIEGRLGKPAADKFNIAIRRGRCTRAVCELALDNFSDASPHLIDGLRSLLRYEAVQVTHVEESNNVTYDIEVPKSHSFIANGIVSHNSLAMGHCARRAIFEGHNVAYFSFEMSDEQNADRMDAGFTGVSMWNLGAEHDYLLETIRRLRMRFPKSLMLRRFSTKQATIQDVRNCLNQIRRAHDWVPDMVVLDYASIVKPPRDLKKKNEEFQEIMEEFRGMCVDLNVVGHTAAQLNRSGTEKHVSDGTGIAGSWDQLATVDYHYVLNQDDEERRDQEIRIFIDKARDGVAQIEVGPLDTSWKKMCFVKHSNRNPWDIRKELQLF